MGATSRLNLPVVRSEAHSRAGVLGLARPAVEIIGSGPDVGDVMAAFARLTVHIGDVAESTAAALLDYTGRASRPRVIGRLAIGGRGTDAS